MNGKGSGAAFIYGFCDENFRENMSKAECKEFCRKAVSYATYRDTSSGGVIRIVDITKDGVTRDYFTHDQPILLFVELAEIISSMSAPAACAIASSWRTPGITGRVGKWPTK